MKYLLLALALILPGVAHAALSPLIVPKIIGAPFIPEVDKRFYVDEQALLQSQSAVNILLGDGPGQSGSGVSAKYTKAIYDTSVQGGSSVKHDLGVSLPAGAVVKKVLVYIDTAFTATSGDIGSLSFGCTAATEDDLVGNLSASTYAINHYIQGGIPFDNSQSGHVIGAAPTNGSIINSTPAGCEVYASVGNQAGAGPLTAGKATMIIDYFQIP